MIQQNITYVVDGWSPMGPNGEYCRKETMAVQTFDGMLRTLNYLNAVQKYHCFTVNTKLISLQDMVGEVDESKETPPGSTTEIQA